MKKHQWIVGILFLVFTLTTSKMNAQDKTTLNSNEQSLVEISALTATGNIEQLKIKLNNGLDNGLSINEIKESLTQLYAYCGFPRSLNAINAFKTVVEERKAKGIIDKEGKKIVIENNSLDKYEQGRKVLQELTNKYQPKPAPNFGEFVPRIDAFLKEHLFADIFACDVLNFQQRELVTISALAAMTDVEAQLQAHIDMGKNTGITEVQLEKVADIIGKVINQKQANILRKIIDVKPLSVSESDMIVHISEAEILPQDLEESKAILKEETSKQKTEIIMNNTEHYTFELSNKVTRQKVTFKNRYGITLSGDLYIPKDDSDEPLAAIAISGPFGAVKEQASGLYANQMAERGFIALAFDPSYTGESSGEPRNVASPDINTEDFSAAIDYLGLHEKVDRNKIGIIGICGFGGFALNATAIDKRVKAVATTSMYDMSRVNAKGYFDANTLEQRTKILEDLSEQRWEDAKNEKPETSSNNLPEKLTGDEPSFVAQYHNYYKTPRGFHPRSINSNGAWTKTTPLSLMNMPILTYIEEISPRPVLIIAGENAHSKYFSEDAYKAAAQPKELIIIPNTVHVDLYDKIDIIPFDKLTNFFTENLK
ncbi:carboxymuconolactone decarboxylase family protein [Bernardetia sp.]|uniref:carboxymuconolactone decarboxylase family protein n=1 Tax=Bernardetia sp. TaxID=1937974 RepID=UPI0025BFD7E1|nr:carboxymuconolactone decarboxylase family protein [Bernardetia sp.]